MDNFSSIFLTSSFSSLSSIDVQPVQPSILERVAPTTSVSGPEPATQWRAGPSVAQCEDVNPIIYAAVSGRSVETSILKNENNNHFQFQFPFIHTQKLSPTKHLAPCSRNGRQSTCIYCEVIYSTTTSPPPPFLNLRASGILSNII